MSIELELKAKSLVREYTSPKRYKHSLRTAETAAALAEKNGVDTEKAKLAGILHDTARDLPGDEIIHWAETLFSLEDWEHENPVLIHGKAAAAIVRWELGVEDSEVLEAICYHTTGAPNMGPVARVVLVSDTIAPGRKHISKKFRKWVFSVPLVFALRRILEDQLKHLKSKHAPVAHITEELYNEVVNEVEKIETSEKN
jgi:predicted HD superfamily hydrolase involved in NAD metabolism